MATKNMRLIAFIIIFMAPLAGMGIDIYSPALPLMQDVLHSTSHLGGMTMTVYLIGYGLGLAVAGPLADSLGRVRVLTAGLYAFILINLGILFVNSISALLIMRFLQGIAVAAPGVMFKVLISDHFDETALPKMSNNASIAWALGPVVAPFVGGYLANHFGWHASFGFLAIYAAIILILRYVCLTESNPNPQPLHINSILSNYTEVLKNSTFIALVIALSLIYAVFILFNVNGPFLIQRTLQLNAMTYGSIALILGLFYFFGVTLNRFLILKFDLKKITMVGVMSFCVGALILLISGFLNDITLSIIMIGLMACYFSTGLMFSNILSSCMLVFREKAGTANAVMNSSFVLGAAVISAIGSHLSFASQIPLGFAYLMMSVIIFVILKKNKPYFGLI